MEISAPEVAPAGQYFNGTCYRVQGDLDAHDVVLFVHGVGLNQTMWAPWCDALSDQYCVITYDLLGHGGTHNPAGVRCLGDFSEQLSVLIQHLGLEKWHLVGFSLGALISLHYLAGDAKGGAEPPESFTLLHSVFERSQSEMDAIEQRYLMTLNEGPMATIEVAIKRWFSIAWIESRHAYIDALREIFRRHVGDDGYLKAYRVFCDADVELAALDLARIESRGLVMTGSLDAGSTPAMAKRLAARLDASLVVNDGHRHMAPVEHVKQMSAQIESFITEA